MVLSASDAVEQTKQLIEWREAEQQRLDKIRAYIRDEQRLDWLPAGSPVEVAKLARMARVNVLGFVVDASSQSLYVDGIRSRDGSEADVWQLWQANRMDARQIGIHRAALSYGASYGLVLPGDPAPVIRGVSPRNMTAMYGDDDEWPMWALEARGAGLWRLFDQEAAYWVAEAEGGGLELVSYDVHDAGVVPVVRYRDTDNLDDPVVGIVEPLMRLQDQINVTTFSLLVAQHYGAHRQRYIIGWLAESEEQALHASAQRLWTFDEDPNDMKIGEFEQTDLKGYIDSREASLRHMATISQTPVHELLGSLANLTAEALVAARDSHERRLTEHRTVLGEAHEQTLGLAGELDGQRLDPGAWVRWRDMGGRSLAQVADALGKFAEMLGIPKRALWERAADVLGASQDEVAEWVTLAESEDSIAQLTDLLMRQAEGAGGPL